MNYLKELTAFRDWAIINRPSTGGVALWYSLMNINNMIGLEWFTVPNPTLQLLTGLSRQGLDSARNSLVQKGRIEYKKGVSNQSGKYRIISLECQNSGTAVDTLVGTVAALEQAQEQRSGCTLTTNNITTTTTTYKRARELLEQEFGHITPTIAQKLDDDVDRFGIEWVEGAIVTSSGRGKRNYIYMRSLLTGWKSDGFTQGSRPWESGGGANFEKTNRTPKGNVGRQENQYSEYD